MNEYAIGKSSLCVPDHILTCSKTFLFIVRNSLASRPWWTEFRTEIFTFFAFVWMLKAFCWMHSWSLKVYKYFLHVTWSTMTENWEKLPKKFEKIVCWIWHVLLCIAYWIGSTCRAWHSLQALDFADVCNFCYHNSKNEKKKMTVNNYVVILFIGTAGRNGDVSKAENVVVLL